MKLNEMEKLLNPPLEIRPLKWCNDTIPGYYIRNDGKLFCQDQECSTWRVNGRNYAYVIVPNHSSSCRVDYMVAYTFLGMYDDAIRLIHINDNIADDSLNNLMWYRKCDVLKEYINMAIIEEDGCIKEEWRPFKTKFNTELGYEISNFGMVRDAKHIPVPIREVNGYYGFFYLDQLNGKRTKLALVHRAVAEAFIPNPHNYELVNHLDGNKYNNIVSNLEWANNSMNMEHAYLQNLNCSIGYTDTQVHRVCKLLSEGKLTHIEISRITGVDNKTVSEIYRGSRWTKISRNYSFTPKKWTLEIKSQIADMIVDGKKCREIFSNLGIPYNQSGISLYERLRRELKACGKI